MPSVLQDHFFTLEEHAEEVHDGEEEGRESLAAVDATDSPGGASSGEERSPARSLQHNTTIARTMRAKVAKTKQVIIMVGLPGRGKVRSVCAWVERVTACSN